jgi:FkbM family methyltransferase
LFETVSGFNKHGIYCVPKSSAEISPPARKIMAGDVYEPDTIDFIINNCGEGDIVHAGAYFGDFLPALSIYCGPFATIWAFEPKEEHHYCANKTLQLNGCINVMLAHAGLGEVYGERTLQTTTDDGRVWGGGSRIVHTADEDKSEHIHLVTLDETIPEKNDVSIVHLDVEGFEKEALMGGLETIKRCLPILILETMPDNKWMTDNIYILGYEITGKLHHNTILQVK